MRTLTCIVALSAALLMSHSALAASAVVKACRTDIKTQCGDEIKSGGAALKECMKKHFSDLSEDCQVAIIRAASVGKACRADAKKLCADVKPGAMAACMRTHAADLSDDCKEALAKSGGK
jgi:Cysteine rich repeat